MSFLLKRWRPTVVVAVLILAAIGYHWYDGRAADAKYVTEEVTQGPIVRSVTATGTVNPVITVQVGTYVSGPITAIYADFNAPVKQGQVIAKIDPRPYAATVALDSAALANARAGLKKDQANLEYQDVTFRRDRELLKQQVVSQDQLDSQKSVFHQAVAQVTLDEAAIEQAQATLKQAQLNLNYTDIVSPVDGTVVSRNVDVGQTVAASFQTPTLFLVAKDLTKMQVDSNVSESDIGGVRVGQKATFKVDAYPDRDFEGIIAQVRQAPITVQNVVTYDVVVNVENPEMLLMPGMTANVNIVTSRADNVVRIPFDAFRFIPRFSRSKTDGAVAASIPGSQTNLWVLGGRRGIH
ncbi:MAG TPA: efflux RND transporter periplasmic adaptor subunit, partial [Candidatus Binataceae bacterium]|nr:efflux RND transporter periplasmic adaptor subunit [Candidatus Binataceae bacterium]